LWEITKRYIEKNIDKLFQVTNTKSFYIKHLATNLLVFYLLPKMNLKEGIVETIQTRVIDGGYFITPISSRGLGHLPTKGLGTYYLALKWFYNEKTKKYYSEKLLKQMKDYEELIKHSMSPGWEERLDFISNLKY